MIKITQTFYWAKNKKTTMLCGLFVLLLMNTEASWGQQPIGTGQYDGGFEGASVHNVATTQSTPNVTKWAYDHAALVGTTISSTAPRSGSKCLNVVSTSSSGKYLMSPKLVPSLVSGVGKNYTVQCWVKGATGLKGAIYTDKQYNNVFASPGYPNNGAVWTKVTYSYTGVATAVAANTWAGLGSTTSAFSANVDDFVVYLGAVDISAPDPSTNPVVEIGSATTLNVGWTAPVTGVDGGGYVVVRYASTPDAANDPLQNSIFALGNTTNGTTGTNGTVVYIGTSTSFVDTVVDATVSYYYKIYTVDKAFNYSTEIIGTAPLTSVWNGSTWLNGTPSQTVEVLVDETYNGAGFDAKKLTVNSGKSLTITTGTLMVQNEVINNGTLVISSNANLIQANSSIVNTTPIRVNRNSNALYRLDYTMWSSPVSGQNLLAFSPLTTVLPNSRFSTYNSSTNLYNAIANPAGVDFLAGTGYLIRMPNENAATDYNTGGAAISYPGVFNGVPNNGTVSLTGLTAGQYIAAGNPYPSTISADAFIDANADVPANGVLYYWRKTNNINQGTSPTTSYATYTKAGGVANGGFTPGSDIQVGQGFITTVPSSGIIAFTNAMRSSSNSAQFLRTKAATNKDRVWLNLSTGTNPINQMMVAYMDGATQGVDAGIDGKYINDSELALTSSVNGGEYVIQGRPAFDASDVVPLNFKTDTAGDYTIAIDHADGVFAAGQDVYLVDSTTGTETNLKSGSYTFTASTGASNSRFALKYQKTLGVNDAAFSENSVAVYTNKGVVYVNSGAITIANVKVYDVQGRLLVELKDVKATSAAINLKAVNQVLVVKVTAEDGAVVTKKVVN